MQIQQGSLLPVFGIQHLSTVHRPLNQQRIQGDSINIRFGKLEKVGQSNNIDIPEVLVKNQKDRFITPSHIQYHHQWLWDAGFHAIILAKFNPEKAKTELETLMNAQWEDGFVPHIHFDKDLKADYRPNSTDWETELNPASASNITNNPTSGITQPPLIATALRTIYEETGDKAFVEKLYPKVAHFHEWMKTDRDPDNSGLVRIIHPWESGTDNSPYFDHSRARLLREGFDQVDVPPRSDAKNVNPDERPKGDDYQMYWGLIEQFKSLDWNQSAMGQKSRFQMADPLFNTVWIKNNQDLAFLAQELGKPKDAKKYKAWARQTQRTMNNKLWDKNDKFYYPLDLIENKQIKIKTVSGLAPIYADVPSMKQAKQVIHRYLLNPAYFNSPSGITGTAMNDETFEEKRYWRGPVWVNTNWFIYEGLKQYGFDIEAQELAIKMKRLVRENGYREYYHYKTGAGLGAPDFSWSALAHLMDCTGMD